MHEHQYINKSTLELAERLVKVSWDEINIEDKAFFADVVRRLCPGDQYDFSNGTVTGSSKSGAVTSAIIPLVYRIIKAVLPKVEDQLKADWWKV